MNKMPAPVFAPRGLHLTSLLEGPPRVKLRCPHCGLHFMFEAVSEPLDCPGCGLKGRIEQQSLRNAFERQMKKFLARLAPLMETPKIRRTAARIIAGAVLRLKHFFPIIVLGFYGEPFGHYIHFTQIFLARLAKSKAKRALVFAFPPERTPNPYLTELWSRRLIMTPAAKDAYDILRAYPEQGDSNNPFHFRDDYHGYRISPGIIEPVFPLPLPKRSANLIDLRDQYWWFDCAGELDRAGSPFIFTEQEHRQARQWLKEQEGYSEEKGFVCFLARDSLYLNKQQPERDWSFHDFRNVDVNSYIPAMNWLADQGLLVLRMGSLSAEPLRLTRPGVLDYSFLPRNALSELLDFYLASHCRLYVTCSSGADSIARVMRRPILAANTCQASPLFYNHAPRISLTTKKLWDQKSGRFLSFREIMTRGLDRCFYQRQYVEQGVRTVENTPDEILEAVRESWARTHGIWQATEEEIKRQKAYAALVEEFNPGIQWTTALCDSFLRANPFLLSDA